MGFIYKEDISLDEILRNLTHFHKEIDMKSPIISFNHSSYYEEEMGENLKRLWVSFENLIDPENISSIKLEVRKIEEMWTQKKQRTVNIDPGILSLNNFILTSFKNYTHRVPLTQGVYADLTLIYDDKKGFKNLEWTYPDYKSEAFLNFLSHVRKKYKIQLDERKT
ncbi:MAG: DUF4416 family protein [Deltaproteobacteria bacterium]|nr:DUF4416 family protein [Deltaproteobacteria bacterium]